MTALHTGGPVICAYEDKPIARHALRASAWLADALESPLVIAHVLDPMGIPVASTREMLQRSVSVGELPGSVRAGVMEVADRPAGLVPASVD